MHSDLKLCLSLVKEAKKKGHKMGNFKLVLGKILVAKCTEKGCGASIIIDLTDGFPIVFGSALKSKCTNWEHIDCLETIILKAKRNIDPIVLEVI
jgi:hypothetical protein